MSNDAKCLAEWVKLKWEFGLRGIPDEVLAAAKRVLADQPAPTETSSSEELQRIYQAAIESEDAGDFNRWVIELARSAKEVGNRSP